MVDANENVEIKTRKRTKNPVQWKRAKEKQERYSSHGLPQYPVCKHNSKAYQCSSLTMIDVYQFHKTFYARTNKIDQDNFILKYCQCEKSARRRPTVGNRSAKNVSLKYMIRKHQDRSLVPVCRNTFLNVLLVKKDRVLGVAQRHFQTGVIPYETRGGDRHTVRFSERKAAVCDFIKKFKPLESHYCRDKSSRLYLSSELNISKMWRMYRNSSIPEELLRSVKESYFRDVFNKNFNISFGTPRTDVCSTCLQLGEKIKIAKNADEKTALITEKKIHSLRAKAFFSLLKEEREGLKTLSFDCQKNQPMPKLPDQATYYSRQLYVYNFTIVTGSSKSSLTRNNVHSYIWTEDEFLKGSNEIASAVFHRLCNTDLEGIHTVRLVADGCGGQNKNTTVLGMCCKWLQSDAPKDIKTIELIFPVTGHSFLPPDRVFALIERQIKKKEVIVEPREYYEVFKTYGTMLHLGEDVVVQDWKSAVQETLKLPGSWHFQFNTTKRFILSKATNFVAVRGEVAYRTDLNTGKNVCKRGKHVARINPRPISGGISPKPLKLRDVNVLLVKHYGIFWKNFASLTFYKNILEKYAENIAQEEGGEHEDDAEHEENCCSQEEIPGVIV